MSRPTWRSSGACITSSAPGNAPSAFDTALASMAVRKSRFSFSRPGSSRSSPSPASRSRGDRSASTSFAPAGVFTSATAATLGSRGSAAATAVPPRLCPTNRRGTGARMESHADAATTVSTLGRVSGGAAAVALAGTSVKSRRSTANPRDTSARASRSGPGEWPRHAKHDTSTAEAAGTPGGSSNRPAPPGKETARAGI
ncbi:hypothetical protein [Corallococcus carmarthensis]|uniref:hypothetical protein n=1 Tax=Corallococcus carmarthensis TaxID=2316728 RepID=UPI001FC9E9C6|nr:hypothetical protein [Corallococcus carmarthensis]